MEKKLLGVLVVCAAVLLAGSALAQLDPPFHILHKRGAIFNFYTGWNLNTPPYYPGNDWAVDFRYGPSGPSILHRDGAIWTSGVGWNLSTPPYYPGTDYAKALEILPDLSGCWCAFRGEWTFWKGGPYPPDAYNIIGDHYSGAYPEEYVQVTQTGDMLMCQYCIWDGISAYACTAMGGSVEEGHIHLTWGEIPAPDACSWGRHLVGSWKPDQTAGMLTMYLASVGSDMLCQGTAAGDEKAWIGSLRLNQKYFNGATWVPCECAPLE